MTNKYLNSIKIVILGLFLSVGVGVVFAQWTGPTASFPNGNVDRPINVGSDLQTKSGSLWANFLGSDTGLYAQGNAEIGGTLTLNGGSPSEGKILMSEDSNGLASWANPPSLNCSRKSSSSLSSSVTVSCAQGEILTGGGGDCGNNNSIEYSKPHNNQERWELRCDQSANITVYAVCCDSQLEVSGPGSGI